MRSNLSKSRIQLFNPTRLIYIFLRQPVHTSKSWRSRQGCKCEPALDSYTKNNIKRVDLLSSSKVL